MNNENIIYLAADGDDIGKRHAQALLDDNVEEINHISSAITEANEMIKDFVVSHGGEVISLGGDEGLYSAPEQILDLLEALRKHYESMVGATLSIGVGSKPSEAGKALLAAKERGKNQIVHYDESVEQEAQGVQQKRDSKQSEENPSDTEEQEKITAVLNSDGPTNTTETESKDPNPADQSTEITGDTDQGVGHDQVLPEGSDKAVNEPTLSEPPKYDNNKGYDSGYKNSNPETREDSYRSEDLTPPTIKKPNLTPKPKTFEAVSTDYQECDRQMNEEPANPGEVGPMIEKPDPKGYHGQAEGEIPESEAQPREDKPSDLKYSPQEGEQIQPSAEIPIENATSDVAEQTTEDTIGGGQHCPSCTCAEHEKPTEEVLDQHIDNAKDFENTLNEPSQEDDKVTTTDLLDQHLDNQKEMLEDMDQNGVSRPADYNEKGHERDMGLSEEESADPDFSEILQGGLEQHAQDIQKEKVIDMVGHALEGFKSQKAILNKAKEQAPELYDSCISMLRSMIELCKLAKIDNSGEAEQEVNEIEGQTESPEEAPAAEEMPEKEEEPCPSCGEPAKAAQGGAAPFPKK